MTDEQRALVEENHNLIYEILKKMNLSLDEYYDLAAIALCEAAESFNPKRGKFSTCAWTFIKNKILLELRKDTLQKYGSNFITLSMQEGYQFDDGDESLWEDIIPCQVYVESDALVRLELEELVKKLDPTERQILKLYFEGYGRNEISKMVKGYSPSNLAWFKVKIESLVTTGEFQFRKHQKTHNINMKIGTI